MNPQGGCKPCPYAVPEFGFTYKSHVQWIHAGTSCHSPLPGIIWFLHSWEGQEYKICVELKIHSNFYSFLLNTSQKAARACQKYHLLVQVTATSGHPPSTETVCFWSFQTRKQLQSLSHPQTSHAILQNAVFPKNIYIPGTTDTSELQEKKAI